jgi:hypothetical protein
MRRTQRVGRHDCCWLSAEARAAKSLNHYLERHYCRMLSALNQDLFTAAQMAAFNLVQHSCVDFLRRQVSDGSNNPKKLL